MIKNEANAQKQAENKHISTKPASQKADANEASDLVVASKFKVSDLYKNEDWWAIWLGFIIIGVGLIRILTGAFTFKAAKIPTWGTESVPNVLQAFSGQGFIWSILFTLIVFIVLFGVGLKVMGKIGRAHV